MKRKLKGKWQFYYDNQWLTIPEISKLCGVSESKLKYRLLKANWSLLTATTEFYKEIPQDWSP